MTIERRLQLLTLSNLAAWTVVGVVLLSGFRSPDRLRVDQLDAERVNIVGPDGGTVMALSNKRYIPGPTFGGEEYPQAFGDGRNFLSGIIFFNEEGDEVGGLVYNGIPKDTGYWAGGHLSFDQWKQNQVVALQYLDNSRTRRAGLRVWDRPTDVTMGEYLDVALRRMESEDEAERDSLRAVQRGMSADGGLGVERLFVGSQDRVAQVQIRDTRGRVRARLLVDENDAPRLEFLDADGEVVDRYPPAD
ncbi:MAG: hypothetical protein PVF05_06535 [Gemmatimonadales bacterium]|jgi:hypothetical protein